MHHACVKHGLDNVCSAWAHVQLPEDTNTPPRHYIKAMLSESCCQCTESHVSKLGLQHASQTQPLIEQPSPHTTLQVQKCHAWPCIGTRANKPNQVRCFAHVSMQHARVTWPWLLWLLLSCHSNRKPQAVPPLLSSSAKMTRFLCTIKCRARQCPTVQGTPECPISTIQPHSLRALWPYAHGPQPNQTTTVSVSCSDGGDRDHGFRSWTLASESSSFGGGHSHDSGDRDCVGGGHGHDCPGTLDCHARRSECEPSSSGHSLLPSSCSSSLPPLPSSPDSSPAPWPFLLTSHSHPRGPGTVLPEK